MVDRRRTTRTSTSSKRTTERPDRDRFSPVRGDLMTRARSAGSALRERTSRTPDAPGRLPGGRGQGAVDFGRAMTGGDGSIDRIKDEILSNVMERLGEKGIYRGDDGSYQIQGLERNDPSRAIRDMAVSGMGGPDWTKIVGGASGGVLGNGGSPGGGMTKTATSVGGVEPMNLANQIIAETQKKIAARQAGITPIRPQISTPSGTPMIPGRKTMTSVGGVEPGMPMPPKGMPMPPKGGVYPDKDVPYPTPSKGVPQPGLGGVPPVSGGIPPQTSFPKDMTNQAAPMTGAMGFSAQTPLQRQPPPGSNFQTYQSQVGQQQAPVPITGTVTRTQPPISPVGTGGTQGIDPNASQQSRIGMGTGGQIIGSGVGQGQLPTPFPTPQQGQQPQINTNPPGAQQEQQQAPQPIPATVYPPGTGQGQAPGPSSTRQGTSPMVPTGGTAGPGQAPVPPVKTAGPAVPAPGPNKNVPLPGQPGAPPRPGMPSRPQMPTTFPNGQPFGGPNPMVDQIQAQVNARLAGQAGGQMPGGVGQGLAGLQGLGDRIAASVQGRIAGAPGAGMQGMQPGGVGTGIAEIMQRVQSQLAQSRMPGGRPPMGPGTGQPMPGGGTGMPTGTGGAIGSYGNQSIDQWDQAFIAAGNKYGVDPTLLKAMMDIESGGNGNLPLDQCRSDGSCGPMQVKPGIWGSVGSVPEQIEQAAKILGDGVSSGQYPDAEAALFGIYFPTGDIMNGTTQGGYAERVHQLQAQMGSYQPGTGQPAAGSTMDQGGIYTTPNGTSQYGYPNATELSQRMATNPYAPAGGGVPTGTIQTTQWGNGASWDTLGQYDATIQAEAAKHGIDPAYIYASMAIESGGADVCNPDGIHCHVLQMDPANSADAARLGYDISTNEGQIGYLAAIASGEAGIGVGNTPEERIISVYPAAGGSAQHVADYTRDWESIVQQYGAAGGGAAAPGAPSQTAPGGQDLQQMGVTNPDGTLTDQALQSLGVAPGTKVLPGQLTPDQLQAIGAGAGASHDPSGGIPVYLDPATGKMVPTQTTPAAPPPATQDSGKQSGQIPQTTGVMNTTAANDGLGIAATTDTDDNWKNLMSPGMNTNITYKQDVTWDVPQMGPCPYCYQEGHGADGYHHAAYDLGADVDGDGVADYGAPIGAPVAGKVVCSGYGNGSSVPGWNCGYAINHPEDPNAVVFEDQGGPSQITLDVGTDGAGNQLLVNMIHLGGSVVSDGQVVQAGEQIGTQGSMGGAVHTHVEGLAICNGTYVYLDATLVNNGYYDTHNACEGY